jgi:AcrR family transcriptional regulator
MRKKNPEETKELLLQAAATLVLEQGAGISLEQVAKAAKVSKGGLLHHFPNKDSLMLGLMEQLSTLFEQHLESLLEPDPAPGRWARGYIRSTFAIHPEEQALTSALAKIVIANPHLLETLKTAFEFAEQRILNDGLPPTKAAMIRLACDGLWFGELTGMILLTEPLRSQLQNELLEMTK